MGCGVEFELGSGGTDVEVCRSLNSGSAESRRWDVEVFCAPRGATRVALARVGGSAVTRGAVVLR